MKALIFYAVFLLGSIQAHAVSCTEALATAKHAPYAFWVPSVKDGGIKFVILRKIEGDTAVINTIGSYWGVPYIENDMKVPLNEIHNLERWQAHTVNRGLIEKAMSGDWTKTKTEYDFIDRELVCAWKAKDGQRYEASVLTLNDKDAIIAFRHPLRSELRLVPRSEIDIVGKRYRHTVEGYDDFDRPMDVWLNAIIWAYGA